MMEHLQIPEIETAPAYRWRVFGLCAAVYLLAGTVSTLMSGYLPVVVHDLLNQAKTSEMDWVSAYVSAIFLYGWMVGGILFGFWGDRLGRVRSLTGAVALYGICTLLIAWAPSWEILLAFRFFAGFGVGGVLVLATVLIAETWPERNRAVAQGVLAVTFPIGIILTGLLNYWVPDWRQAFLLGFAPALLSIGILLSVAEPKVASKLPKASARASLATLKGGYPRQLMIGAVAYGAMLVGLWAIFSWTPTWVQSLVTEASDGQKERGLSMMLLGGGGVLGGIISGFIIRLMGYRKTLLLVFGGCFVFTALLFRTNSGLSALVYVEMALLALAFGIGQGALSAWLPELFPTALRSTATGFCFNIGRIATATAVFFVGPLVAILGGYGPAIFAFSIAFILGFASVWSKWED